MGGAILLGGGFQTSAIPLQGTLNISESIITDCSVHSTASTLLHPPFSSISLSSDFNCLLVAGCHGLRRCHRRGRWRCHRRDGPARAEYAVGDCRQLLCEPHAQCEPGNVVSVFELSGASIAHCRTEISPRITDSLPSATLTASIRVDACTQVGGAVEGGEHDCTAHAPRLTHCRVVSE